MHFAPDRQPRQHPTSFLQAGCPSCHPTNSFKALKESHLVAGSNIDSVELVGAEMVDSQYQLLCLNVETHNSVVRQSRLKQLLLQQRHTPVYWPFHNKIEYLNTGAGFVANSKYKTQALFKHFSRTQIAFFKHQNYRQKAIS